MNDESNPLSLPPRWTTMSIFGPKVPVSLSGSQRALLPKTSFEGLPQVRGTCALFWGARQGIKLAGYAPHPLRVSM